MPETIPGLKRSKPVKPFKWRIYDPETGKAVADVRRYAEHVNFKIIPIRAPGVIGEPFYVGPFTTLTDIIARLGYEE